MGQWCLDQGIQFEPMDEAWLLQPHIHKNIQELWNIFRRANVPAEVKK